MKGIKQSFVFVCALFLTFVVTTGASYYFLKDKFAVDHPYISDADDNRVRDMRVEKVDDINRLYTTKTSNISTRSGTVYRKDTLLVAAEDFIRQQVSSYRARLLDLYLDKNGIIYVDLGSEIIKNFAGDVSEEVKLIGELYQGLKRTIPGLRALKILVEGKETESLGGHIDIMRPIGEGVVRNNQ